MHVIHGESADEGGQNATAFSGVEYYMDFMAKVPTHGVETQMKCKN